MKPTQMRTIINAVQQNISLLISSKGESPLIGLEEFTPQMLEVFDALYDAEVAKLMK